MEALTFTGWNGHACSFDSVREKVDRSDIIRRKLEPMSLQLLISGLATVNIFLGMTVHCLNRSHYQQKKAAADCKAIRGKNTRVVGGVEVEQIVSFYELSNQEMVTVTNNGSIFAKAFKV